MAVQGCCITYSLSAETQNSTFKSCIFNGSGIKFCDRWVLAHGSLVAPLKNALKIMNTPKNIKSINKKENVLYSSMPDMFISHENSNLEQDESQNECHENSTLEQNKYQNGCLEISDRTLTDLRFSGNVIISKGRIRLIWKCPVLADVVLKMLSMWTIGHKDGSKDEQNSAGKDFLSTFLLIDIGDFEDHTPVHAALHSLYSIVSKFPPDRGQEVYILSTPFGNAALMNLHSQGVVCGDIQGRKNARLVLCDASAALGSEGGPAFYQHSGHLFGMVVSALSWWRGEWVGLTLLAPLAPCLHNLLQLTHTSSPTINLLPKPIQRLIDSIDSMVALIRCGDSWGSGLSLGRGYFLTCSHVVKNHDKYGLSMYMDGEQFEDITVVYRSADDKVYDLAVIQIKTNVQFNAIKLASRPPVTGERIIAVGYPYFNERNTNNLKPVITRGNILRSSHHMLSTSCCVQSGCSGGGILRLYVENNAGESLVQCELMGVIASNIKDDGNNALFPNINLAIPFMVFKDIIEEYLKCGASSVLKNLQESHAAVNSLWKLQICESKL